MAKKYNQKRLNILGEDEIEAIFGRPNFTYEDRCHYFALSQPEKELLQRLRSVNSKAYFILQLGYFKAKQQFFIFDFQDVKDDVQYVLKQHFHHFEMEDLRLIDKLTRLNHQQLILQVFGYRSCGPEERQNIKKKARQLAKVSGKPIFIFREIMNYLADQRIVVPGYSYIQETAVGQAITFEQHRLINVMRHHLKQADIQALGDLLKDSEGFYEITRLKREPKDFKLKEIRREIDRGEQIQPLYHLAKTLLPKLDISNESIKYFASLVNYYSVYKLKRLDDWMVYVYLLCFVFHRYQQMNDNLINTFLYNVRNYVEEARLTAKEQVYQRYTENRQNIKKAGEILQLLTDDNIAADTPFGDVQEKAFSILERQKLNRVANQIVTNAKMDETALQWEHIDQLADKFKRHLRSLLLMIEFSAPGKSDPLMEAISFIKQAFRQKKSLGQYASEDLPSRFLSDHVKRYIYHPDAHGRKTLRVDRYEFLIYRLLRHRLEAGDIFCHDSIRFRSFEDDLIDDKQWQQKDTLMTDAGLAAFNQPIHNHVANLEQQLETKMMKVNQRIASGENGHVKKRGSQGRWKLPYTRDAETINHSFFDALGTIDIGSVLHYANQHCSFMDTFEHILGRYAKQTRDDQVLIACLVAWGTNMGLGRMGEISDIGYPLLAATSDNFIRLETLNEANNRVSNAIRRLSIFHHFDINEAIHSSSDGQKYETGIHTIHSRHSPKYFGLKRGVVSYTLVANHIPVNAQIIGANEHESHYVFDILYNNTTDIQPEVHSTDTHGTNEVNFAMLHFFDYQFAPRYKDIYDTVSKSLYGFSHPSQYGDILIKPVRKINTNLIAEEWENIQRIVLSLALKSTTQSIIIGKLSAHARKNKTKRALWEYDNIIKSLYFLDYIDSLSLRQNVQRSLNRGESYHKLHRAVSYANFGKLRFKNEQEQQIWDACGRLIANCIIYYNANILSNMLEYRDEKGLNSDALKRISPVAWQHINFFGHYEFNKYPEPVNMEAIIQQLAQSDIIVEE